MSRPRVVFVDDDAALRRLAELSFEGMDVDLVLCDGAEAARAALRAGPADLLITDLMMPGETGIELLHSLVQAPALRGNARLAVFSAAGYWWVWVTLWLLPMMTWLPLISRVRNIAEHALVDQNEADPLRQARTTHASWLERAVLAPYWVNYHSEHHLFTQVPCWNLPKAHALLQARGVTGRMETQPGYLTVLRLATAAQGWPAGGQGPVHQIQAALAPADKTGDALSFQLS